MPTPQPTKGPRDQHALEMEDVWKVFRQGRRRIEALRGVDVSVPSGQLLAIMGASGSGKSTLLHIAAGIEPATRGRVRIGGTDVSGVSDAERTRFRRRNIGLVFQGFNLLSELTAWENVALPLVIDGVPEKEVSARVGEMMAGLGLTDRRDHRPEALSGGEQQRVAIARALVTEPAIVLADEPTGNLDSATGREVVATLRRLNRELGRTILLVTHEAFVASHADRVLVLRDGRFTGEFLIEDPGNAAELAAKYQGLAD